MSEVCERERTGGGLSDRIMTERNQDGEFYLPFDYNLDFLRYTCTNQDSIRDIEAPSTRHRLGSFLLPHPFSPRLLSTRPFQIPTPLFLPFLGCSRDLPLAKLVAPAAWDCVIRLFRNRSLSSGCPNVSFPGIILKHILIRRLAFTRPSSPSMLAA